MRILECLASWRESGRRVAAGPVGDGNVAALVGITVLAVVARIGSALYQGDSVVVMPGTFDQVSYDALAHRVQDGFGFSFGANWWPATRAGEPTAHWSFLYTLFLTAVYSAFGAHPLVARLIQAIFAGIVQPWLTWRIGNRIFGRRVGLIAAALSAVYAYFVYYAGAMMTETFFILAVLWTVDLATQHADPAGQFRQLGRGRAWNLVGPWVLLGLALGIAALLRQLVLLLVPFLIGWLVWTMTRRRRPEEGNIVHRHRMVVFGPVITVAVIAMLILPWTARNYVAFGRLVPLNTNSGYVLYWSNHPIHGTNFMSLLPSGTYYDLIPAELKGMDEAALDQELLSRAVRIIGDDPWRYAQLSASRVRDYFEFWPSDTSSFPSNLARVSSFGVMLPFVLYGLFLCVADYRRHIRKAQLHAVVLLALFLSIYSAIHLLSWALVRYRLPLDALLVLFAGVALTDVWTRLNHSGNRVFALDERRG